MIKAQEKALRLFVLYLANTYTGANFSSPPNADEKRTLQASAMFILDKFPMLHMEELEEAFSLCMSGKLGNMNIEAYYGKFTIQMLGKVIRAYIKYRSSFLVKFNQTEELEARQLSEETKNSKNEQAKQKVISEYNRIKKEYQENGDIEKLDNAIFPYWGKILVDAEIIKFTHDEKVLFVEEAKNLVRNQLESKLEDEGDKMRAVERREFRTLLAAIQEGEKNDTFERKWIAAYSKLIVIKSIIN